MRKNKKLIALVVSISLILGLCSCGNKAAKKSSGDVTNIEWYVMGTRQQDQDTVIEEFNKILNEKYKLNLELNVVDAGAYNDKMNMIMASNTPYDLCWTSNWSNPFTTAAVSGAFYAIDDLLAEKNKALYDALPEFVWDDAKVDGKIYAVPNYQVYYNQPAALITERFVKKYNIDTENLKSVYNFEPVLKTLYENEKDIFTISPVSFTGITLNEKYQRFGNASFVAVEKLSDGSLKAYSTHELPEYLKELELYRDWYNKGYIRKDIISASSENAADTQALRYGVWYGSIKPGSDALNLQTYGENIVAVPLTEPLIKPGAGQATMNAVSNASEHPEEALKLLEIMNTDKELYNLMCFGIEGTHYEKISEKTVRSIAEGNKVYNPNLDWVYGNQFNAYLREGQAEDTWEVTDKINKEAEVSFLRGFNLDLDPIKTEVAKINSVLSEYDYINLGAEDVVAAWNERSEKLKLAGIDTVVNEVQKQLDAWAANK